MAISTTYRDNSITGNYNVTVNNTADNDVNVAAPQKQSTAEAVKDTFESTASTVAEKLGGPFIGVKPSEEKDIPTWTKQEEAAYNKALQKMAVGDQEANNACGTTSLANALSFFGLPFNDTDDFKFIDKAIRPWNLGAGTPTGPGDIVKFARNLGMQSQEYSKCSLEDVAKQLRDGRTVTVVCNYHSPKQNDIITGDGVHYVNIIGVKRDKNGEISQVHIRNPWGDTYKDEILNANDFMKMWTNVRASGVATGGIEDILLAVPICDRTMIVVDTPDAKPLETANPLTLMYNSNIDVTINGVNGLPAGINAIKNGAIGAGLGQTVGAAINTVVGGSCYIVGNLIGKNVEEGGDKLMDIGKSMLKGNLLQKIGGGLAVFFGAIAKAIGWILNTLTNIQSSLVGWLTDKLSKAGEEWNARHAATEAMLNGGTSQIGNADLDTQKALFELLSNKGIANNDEQRAAYNILVGSYFNNKLGDLVDKLGGREAVLKTFRGDMLNEATNLLNKI